MNMGVLTFDRFTQKAGAALVFAQQEALRLGYTAIEVEHILLGLLSVPDTVAVRILQALGIERESLRSAIMAVLQAGDQREGEIPLSSRVKKVFEFAADEMVLLRKDYIGTEHLLLGLLREEESHTDGLLHAQGVRLNAARTEIARIYAQMAAEKSRLGAAEASSSLPLPGDGSPDILPVASTSAPAPVLLDSLRQQQAVQLARHRQKATLLYRFTLVAMIILLTIFMLASPSWLGTLGSLASVLANTPVLAWQPVVGWSPFLVLFYFSLVILIYLLVYLPFACYIGFFAPRRFGLTRGTVWTWLALFGRFLLFFLFQLCLLAEAVALLVSVQAQTWWVWITLLQFLFLLLLGRFGSTWRFSWVYTVEPLLDDELNRRLSALLARLHISTCRIFVVKIGDRASGANASFSGWGKGRCIVLTDTLIRNFTLDEIEVILVHELAHLVHHDAWKRLLMRQIIYTLIYLELHLITDPNIAVFNLIMMMCILIALAIFSNISRRYYRYQEYQADELALQVTGKIQAFKNAMTRLTEKNLLVATSSRRARHPASHPTLVKRLQHADDFAARTAASLLRSS